MGEHDETTELNTAEQEPERKPLMRRAAVAVAVAVALAVCLALWAVSGQGEGTAVEQAVGSGDETLSGDAGREVVDTATGNAAANPNADKEKVEEAGEQAEGEDENPSAEDAPASAQKPSGSSGGGNAGGTASGSGGGSASGGGSGSSSSSTGAQQQPHAHNWVAQTAQKWVQDSAAWTEQVKVGSHILCTCGQTFNSDSEWTAHDKSLGPGNQHGYSVVPTYEEVYHEATGHYETVTTGYKCSGCGAVK